MATRKVAQKPVEKLVMLDPETGEIKDVPSDVLRNRGDLHQHLAEEAERKRFWLKRLRDYTLEGQGSMFGIGLIMAGCVAIGAVLGIFGQPHFQSDTQEAQIAAALKSSIKVVSATEISGDPGKYSGKLLDVVMTPTRGGIFRSGKGLYIAESDGGMSFVIFESAFAAFQTSWKVESAQEIVPYLVGKTVKVRGTIQTRTLPDGASRTSMIVFAPGLVQVLPDRH